MLRPTLRTHTLRAKVGDERLTGSVKNSNMSQTQKSAALLMATAFLILTFVMKVTAQTSPGIIGPQAPCVFSNASTISASACSKSDSDTMLGGLIPCLPYLNQDVDIPSAKCCVGVTNVSTLHPPCLCKVTFYPPPSVNVTRQKLMPGLCNVTMDLCTYCAQFVVARTSQAASPDSGPDIRMYKKKVIGLGVVLALILACVTVGIGLIVRRKLKARKSSLPAKTFQNNQPGSDY